jgi:hypothetical protein
MPPPPTPPASRCRGGGDIPPPPRARRVACVGYPWIQNVLPGSASCAAGQRDTFGGLCFGRGQRAKAAARPRRLRAPARGPAGGGCRGARHRRRDPGALIGRHGERPWTGQRQSGGRAHRGAFGGAGRRRRACRGPQGSIRRGRAPRRIIELRGGELCSVPLISRGGGRGGAGAHAARPPPRVAEAAGAEEGWRAARGHRSRGGSARLPPRAALLEGGRVGTEAGAAC